MGRRGWALVLVACLLLAVVALERAWTPAPPPGAGVQAFPEAREAASPSTSPSLPPPSPSPPTPVPRREPAVRTAAPVTVSVPDIGVTAAVDPVGVEGDGSMTIPRDGARVGWYRYGPAPGALGGSAVIAGHVDTRADGPGALFRLAEVEPGAEVTVTDAAGRTLRYTVVGRQSFDKTDLPVERIFARDGPARLTLITCGGPFDRDLRRYRDNVVVVAEPADGSA